MSDELVAYDKSKLSRLRALLAGGARLPFACELRYKALLPNLKCILNAYGMTETGITTISSTTNMLGLVIPGNEIIVSWQL